MHNTAKHTPGPWVVHTFTISGKEKLEVLDATGTNACVQANAHLIAAAPAMYEALQDAYEKLCYLAPDKFDDEEHAANWQRDLSTMLAALAQAEGRER